MVFCVGIFYGYSSNDGHFLLQFSVNNCWDNLIGSIVAGKFLPVRYCLDKGCGIYNRY